MPFLQMLTTLIDSFPLHTRFFYYCLREYYSQDFSKVEGLLKLSGKQIFEPVMIDRFLFSEERISNPDEGSMIIKMEAEKYRTIICKERISSTLRPSQFVYKIRDNDTFEYYINRQNLLVEGVYQFLRVLNFKKIKSRLSRLYDNLIEEFLKIQVNRVMKDISNTAFETISGGITKSQFKENLLDFGRQNIERVIHLSGYSSLNADEDNLAITKKKNIFPSGDDFYHCIKKSDKFYEDSEIFVELEKMLEISPLHKYYTLFISYSVKDRKIAVPIAQRLSLMGIRIRMYEKDNPTGNLPMYMSEQVSINDKMLFISSVNSLKSNGCHTELTKCREQIQINNDIYKLIPIRIDDYVLDVKDEEIRSQERLENIKMLREFNVQRYALFNEKINLYDLDYELSKMVEDSLIKNL